jgi:hypothetical protein
MQKFDFINLANSNDPVAILMNNGNRLYGLKQIDHRIMHPVLVIHHHDHFSTRKQNRGI